MSRIVLLDWAELTVGAMVGALRQGVSLKDGKEHQYGYRPDAAQEWTTHAQAAQAEIAVAKAMGRYWPPSVNAAKADPDIPPNVQVRLRRQARSQLVVRPNDIDTHFYVSVFAHPRERMTFTQRFELYGYILGADAKRVGRSADPQGRGAPAFFVDDAQLLPCGAGPADAAPTAPPPSTEWLEEGA